MKRCTVAYRHPLSEVLGIYRIVAADGSPFPPFEAGQHIELRRENCRLTKKSIGREGEPHYEYDTDDAGRIRRGPVQRSFSIASAPFETRLNGYLEFYAGAEVIRSGPGAGGAESLFLEGREPQGPLFCRDAVAGDFTLGKRAAGVPNVVFVAAGTGLAPVVSMLKQLNYDAVQGRPGSARYTLLYANRTLRELGYHEELSALGRSAHIDLVYIPSVSRPEQRDYDDPSMGKGRANNILRSVWGMPMSEEEPGPVTGVPVERDGVLRAVVRPILPAHISRRSLLDRMQPGETVVLACGNRAMTGDIAAIAGANGLRCEREDW